MLTTFFSQSIVNIQIYTTKIYSSGTPKKPDKTPKSRHAGSDVCDPFQAQSDIIFHPIFLRFLERNEICVGGEGDHEVGKNGEKWIFCPK